jgi:hypothetical protein
MKAISPASNVLWKMSRSSTAGIPIITPKFVSQTQEQLRELEGKLSNVHFLGMVPGIAFFKREVLVQAYERISKVK